MRRFLFVVSLGFMVLAAGCQSSPAGAPGRELAAVKPPQPSLQAAAALVPLSDDHKAAWKLPDNLISEGGEVLARVVAGAGLLAPQALELAAGDSSRAEYFMQVAGAEPELSYRFQFLSTQGTGRFSITALARDGRRLATVGYVFTGAMPMAQERTVWLDQRLANNYQGGWVAAKVRLSELVSAQLGSFAPESAASYRVSLEAGQGQHVLITELKPAADSVAGVKVVWKTPAVSLAKGEEQVVSAAVANSAGTDLRNLTVRLVEPFGYGIVVADGAERQLALLATGDTAMLQWRIKGQRASAVNLGQPWEVRLAVNGTVAPPAARVQVADTSPGRVVYVMTEDLEPMDAAGYPKAWGNQNGWLDAEEFKVQLVDKAEAINRIAEKHGAFWTHYLAMPALAAGEWAAAQSSRPTWRTVLDQVRASVRAESGRGHEYALHLHSDYDPAVPGNVLSYHPPTDGFWANHLRHGWAHSFPEEGSSRDRASRTGILTHHLRELTQLTESFPGGEVLTARTGSFDFGNGPESEAMSMRAYRLAGLWGNSDADGNVGGITSGDFRKAVYLTPPDDINAPATDLRRLGIVEFRPTPKQMIMYDIDSAATMNEKARQGMAEFVENGKVKPGVQAIVGFTHAMFIMSPQGWKSTSGGAFKALDDHLAFLKREYVDKGLLLFGTATDLVREYLDYYWPEPLAFFGPLQADTRQGREYGVRFTGRDIPVDGDHPHPMKLKIPLRHWESGLWATLLKNGAFETETWLTGDRHELAFVWNNRQDAYQVRIGDRMVRGLTPPGLKPPGQTLFETKPVPGGTPLPLPPQPEKLFRDAKSTGA